MPTATVTHLLEEAQSLTLCDLVRGYAQRHEQRRILRGPKPEGTSSQKCPEVDKPSVAAPVTAESTPEDAT